jgi:hypothetical protein
VRVPGLAVAPALVLLLWIRRKALFQERSVAVAVSLAVLLPVVAYFALYRLVVQSDREETYLAALTTLAGYSGGWLFPLQLAWSQVRYLFVSTGYWVLPVFLVIALQVRHVREEARRRRWVNFLVFAGVTSAAVLGFAIVHLTEKMSLTADTGFIYGRYDDPAGLLLLIGGLAGVLALGPLTGVQRVFLRVVAPLAFCLVLGGMLTTKWIPVNQCGLSIFSSGNLSVRWLLVGTVLATSVSQLVDDKRRLVPAALGVLLAFGVASDWQGMVYTIGRARKVAFTVAGGGWIAANVPEDARIGYDGSIIDQPAPGMDIRTLMNVYTAMMFRTHPRATVVVDSADELAEVDYLYSTTSSTRWTAAVGGPRLEQVWANGAYVLYRVSPGAS